MLLVVVVLFNKQRNTKIRLLIRSLFSTCQLVSHFAFSLVEGHLLMAHESNLSVKIKEENKRLLREESESKGFVVQLMAYIYKGKPLVTTFLPYKGEYYKKLK